MRLWIVLATAAALVMAIGAATWLVWAGQGPVDLPVTAYIALTLGIVLTVALGCGLMALVFFSSRRGYDERADRGIR